MQKETSVVDQLMFTFMEISRLDFDKGPMVKVRPAEVATMMSVRYSERQRMKTSEIALALNVAAPSVTTILNRLEEKGYILRQTDEKDRRAVQVTLTTEGETALDEVMTDIRSRFEALSHYLGEQDTGNLLYLLRRVCAFCGHMEPCAEKNVTDK